MPVPGYFSYGNTAQYGGTSGGAYSAICCLQISRFTASKPSKSAIATVEKFTRQLTTLECVSKMPEAHLAGNSVAVTASLTAFLR